MDALYGFESWRQHSKDLQREVEQARLARVARGNDHPVGVKTLLNILFEKFNGKVLSPERAHVVTSRGAGRNRRCKSKAA